MPPSVLPGVSTPWLTVPEAADRARVGARLIYAAVGAGQLRAARVGGRRALRLRPEWVDAWLEHSAAVVEIAPNATPLRVVRG